jgi:hypothetical protein
LTLISVAKRRHGDHFVDTSKSLIQAKTLSVISHRMVYPVVLWDCAGKFGG